MNLLQISQAAYLRHSGQAKRDPESRKMELVPDFRRDDVWTPVFTGVTVIESFVRTSDEF
ncbi:MAG: hypothetical protein C0407_05835 [Desulfobacca sp.]|nr:hypothetical protein [Desulfobacca sp.]